MPTNTHSVDPKTRTSRNRARAYGPDVDTVQQEVDRPTVLIVDDDVEFLELLTAVLRREGMDVVRALDGHEALQKCGQVKPNIILLDLVMPGMDGWETFRRLRAFTDTPVVVVSARAAEEDVVTGLEYGVDDYITKPFHIRELGARVRAILRRSPTEQQESLDTHPEVELAFEPDPSNPELTLTRMDAGSQLHSGRADKLIRTLTPAHRGIGERNDD